jgi:hypothetical protein
MRQTNDRLAMMMLGQGKTKAHRFIHDLGVDTVGENAEQVCKYAKERAFVWAGPSRVFIPPTPEDRVLMFSDNSGAYIHADGFATPMGEDISHEIGAWQEVE